MRRLLPLAALLLLGAAAQAQTMTSPATPAPQGLTPAPATGGSGGAATPGTRTRSHSTAPTHHRRTMQERFDAANVTHDGHLTQQQAQDAHWTRIAGHFSEIDKDNRGYVTLDDIHAYNRASYAARRAARAARAASSSASTAPSPAPAAPGGTQK
ncbi:MAG: hypothetical protein JO209_07915 [Acidisphaera sp.]|nr:hypothetical protein [Acidisphaera sp.]